MRDIGVLRSSVMSTEVSRHGGITILRTPGRRYPDINPETVIACHSSK